jgi:hypothetical protein
LVRLDCLKADPIPLLFGGVFAFDYEAVESVAGFRAK